MLEHLGLIAGTAAGGVTGLIGSLIGRVFGFMERRQQLKEKQLEFEQEVRLLELQQGFKVKEREHERRLAVENNDTHLRLASYHHDHSDHAAQWVINTLRLVRPVLTGALVGLAFIKPTTETLYLATTAVSWWFGDRGRNR